VSAAGSSALPRSHGWTVADIPDQSGRTIVVTGANGGLGLRTAEALAGAGAEVLMACRDQAKAAAALSSVAAGAAGAAPRVVVLDLSDLSSVRACAEQVLQEVDQLDGLVNNAGVMAIPLTRTVDGFEMQFATNHLGHFALTGLLLPALLRADAARVVNVSSIAHWSGRMRWDDLNWTKRYERWLAYGQSKLANLLFTSELARRARLAGTPLVAVAAHPGVSDTNLYAAGPGTSRSPLSSVMTLPGRFVGQPDTVGALPQLRALTDPEVRGDDFIGASRPGPGPLGFRGPPERVGRSPLARSSKDAGRLWDRSERLTGVRYEWGTT